MAGIASNLSVVVLIVCGAVNALLSKVVYQLEGQDCSGTTKPFQKPWLQTAAMFLAMAFCLPIAWVFERWEHRKKQRRHGSIDDTGDSSRGSRGGRADSKGREGTAAARGGAAQGTGDSTAVDLQQPLLQGRQQQQQHGEEQQQQQQQPPDSFSFKEGLLLCIPTAFDLTATTLMNVGLLYVAASVFQILRGAEMVFAALFAVLFLKRHLNRWHITGVSLCMTGMVLVGISRVLAGNNSGGDGNTLYSTEKNSWLSTPFLSEGAGGSSDPKMAVLGMGLIVLSQAIQAGQVTVEDHFMSEMHIHPLKVVGWEGVIGSIVMGAGALPLLQHLPFEDGSGLAEDTVGSWCMIRGSPTITIVLLVSSLAVLIYNISGMYVTEQVGAAARTVLENARTLLVWLAALVLFYTHAAGGNIGEAWDQWSWLQGLGFLVFATGAFLYDKGHKEEDDKTLSAGRVPQYSKWAHLKSTLGIHTGHYVGTRRFRAAGDAVLAGIRARNLTEAANGRNNHEV